MALDLAMLESRVELGVMRVAMIATTYFSGSHADVIASRLLDGYLWAGRKIASPLALASLYIEQSGSTQDAGPMPDIGHSVAARAGIEVYPTVVEALGCGQPGVNVDGVLLIGEHGDFEFNVYGQKLYPRRRLFDAAVSAMVASNTIIPVFNDKHLAWSTDDAHAMLTTANRLGVPLLAGSTIPLTWREPAGAELPSAAVITEAVAVGYGPREMYGFHILEGLQVHMERRFGGETGVASVRAMAGLAARRVLVDGTVSADLLRRALLTQGVQPESLSDAIDSVREVFLIDYSDGTRAAAVNLVRHISSFSFACEGPAVSFDCEMRLDDLTHDHFTFLVRQIESMVENRRAPYPAERTFLTGGVLDAGMKSLHHSGAEMQTPLLDVVYSAPGSVPNSGAYAE